MNQLRIGGMVRTVFGRAGGGFSSITLSEFSAQRRLSEFGPKFWARVVATANGRFRSIARKSAPLALDVMRRLVIATFRQFEHAQSRYALSVMKLGEVQAMTLVLEGIE